jgi:hypothetical protein
MRLETPDLLKTLIIAVVITSSSCGTDAQVPVPADQATTNQPINEVRFPVALQHSGSWCYGYLYGSQERIRFEVVQPDSEKSLSFDAPRAEVTVVQWLILGMPQDAIELKSKGATYHMRLLANEGDVRSGAARRWGPPNSLPPYSLIAAMQNPAAALAQGGNQVGDSASNPMGSPRLSSASGIGNTSAAANVAPGGSTAYGQ